MSSEHLFTGKIKEIIQYYYPNKWEDIYEKSFLLQYLNIKTRSANRGSKARSSFANHYALYTLIEDYINKGFIEDDKNYSEYDGAKYSELFKRQRELPFGKKLQNHAFNHRLNQEFKRYFPTTDYMPIIRDVDTKRYWINENLLKIKLSQDRTINIACIIIDIIDAYIEVKISAFENFIQTCEQLSSLSCAEKQRSIDFVNDQIKINVDARIFEIVTFSILKAHYSDQIIYWGWSPEDLKKEILVLYKTGRTNANDGGIDFVMKPLGRFFQVTETLDVKKYFLDIDKIHRFPLTFIIKTELSVDEIKNRIREQALLVYGIKSIVGKYMSVIEEIINIPQLKQIFNQVVEHDKLNDVINEIIIQSKVEFNYD